MTIVGGFSLLALPSTCRGAPPWPSLPAPASLPQVRVVLDIGQMVVKGAMSLVLPLAQGTCPGAKIPTYPVPFIWGPREVPT